VPNQEIYVSVLSYHDRLAWKYRHAAVVIIAGKFLVWKVSKQTTVHKNSSVKQLQRSITSTVYGGPRKVFNAFES